MKSDDVTRLEAAVRSANPVPHTVDLLDSSESAAVALLVRNGREPMTSTPAPQQLQHARTEWRRAWAFAAAFVMVLVGIGAATLLLRGGDDSSFAEQPDGAPIEGAVQMGPVTWMKVDTGDTWIPQIAAFGEGFVGARHQTSDSGAVLGEIVTSPDGVIWTPIADNPLGDDEKVFWRDGGVWGAVGEVVGVTGPSTFEILFIRSDGSSVRSDPATEAGLPPGEKVVRGIAGGDAGLIVAYHLPEIEPPGSEIILSSTDGATWQEIDKPEGLIFARSLTGTPFGYLMSAEADLAERSNPGILTWLSSEGRTWEEVIVTDAYLADIGTTASWNDGVVTLGVTYDHATETGGYQIYRSVNAKDWTEMDMTPFQGLSPIGLSGTDRGLLALVDDGGVVSVMFSADGEAWISMGADEIFGSADVDLSGIATGPDRFVVSTASFGSDFADGNREADLWVGVVERAESTP